MLVEMVEVVEILSDYLLIVTTVVLPLFWAEKTILYLTLSGPKGIQGTELSAMSRFLKVINHVFQTTTKFCIMYSYGGWFQACLVKLNIIAYTSYVNPKK